MITLWCPEDPESGMLPRRERLLAILKESCRSQGEEICCITRSEDLKPVKDGKIAAVILLDGSGINTEWSRMLRRLRTSEEFCSGCTGMVITDAPSELYTKAVGREAVLAMNHAGCAFPGRPLVEGTASLKNYQVTAKLLGTDLPGAYDASIRELVRRLCHPEAGKIHKKPRLLVLHASIRSTSNTMRLWEKVKSHLGDTLEIREMSLRNGEILDCGGCPFTMCMHFSEKGQCYYGGVIVDEVYPAVEECDAILMLCPNYNDAISANLTAFVNRLTALYRRKPFFDKQIFGLVVSGYSGGDIVARQLISALNMNKAFRLPPGFVMIETANDPGSIDKVPGIEERAGIFAERIRKALT